MAGSAREKELIRRSLQGEEHAFALLVAENRPTIFRHCLSVLKDESLAEDITQETFVHAFNHLASFRMEAKFATWLWRIAHNLSLNYLKKHHRVEEEFHEELRYPPFLERGVSDKEMLIKIEEAMNQLSPKLKVSSKCTTFKESRRRRLRLFSIFRTEPSALVSTWHGKKCAIFSMNFECVHEICLGRKFPAGA